MTRTLAAMLVVAALAYAPAVAADGPLPLPVDPPSPNSLPAHGAKIIRMVENVLGHQIPTSGPDCWLDTDSYTAPYPAEQPIGAAQYGDPQTSSTTYVVWVLEAVFLVTESCGAPLGQDPQNGQGPPG